MGRRLGKTVTAEGITQETRFIWQGFRLLQEQSDGICHSYVYDPADHWSPVARIDHHANADSGEIFWFSTDLNSAPLEVTDADGNLCWSGQYSNFGEVRGQSHGFKQLTHCDVLAHQPLRYAGQYADTETGLHYNLFRYYDPQIGRFTVQDPIGLAGGLNLYQYAPNPLTWVDPLGLWTYNTMKSYFGFQKHHIVPQQLKEHALMKASGMNIHAQKNIIYLPKSAEYHPTRTIHNGSHSEYTDNIKRQMDQVLKHGQQNNWRQTDYKNALNDIINEERSNLRSGKTTLNQKHQRTGRC